jgi:hypothetical protein
MEIPSVSFSTDFYMQGNARGLRYGEDLPVFAAKQPVYVIMANDRWDALPQEIRDRAEHVGNTPSHKLIRWPRAGANGATPP